MNPHRKSPYYVDCLTQTRKATTNIDIAYHERNEEFVCAILPLIPGVISDIEDFYSCSIQPKISIFVYPDLHSMSTAFGRELKSDQWCFVPITREPALVTFTANIKKEALSQILIHEFSHVYFSSITGNVDVGNFRTSIPLWLDEGIAFHLDSKYRPHFDQTRQKRLSALQSDAHPYFPKLMDLHTYFNRLDAEEFGIKSEKAYFFSYFCVQDLLEQFGGKHLLEFLNLPDLANDFDHLFEAHFQCSLPVYNSKMTKKYGPPTRATTQ